jgi:chaperone required for assembly of F1-ATPase
MARRFYKTASVAGSGPFTVLLDDRKLKTPRKQLLAVDTRRLASEIAREWQRQGDVIDPSTMPATRIANTAIDRVKDREREIVEEIVGFANSDAVCYRAASPPELLARQREQWEPILEWAADRLRSQFVAVEGVMHRSQPPEALDAVRHHLLPMNPFRLCALHNLTTLTGSALLALAVSSRRLTPDEAWRAAHVDEDWQVEHWGRDAEAEDRRNRRRREFDETLAFLEHLA